MKEVRYLKRDDIVDVFQTSERLGIVFKKYLVDGHFNKDAEDLRIIRNKLMAIKRRRKWPEFLIKPAEVGRLNKYSLTAEFPFVPGCDLKDYVKGNDIDLETSALFLDNLEKAIYAEEDFVFPDIANLGNIRVLPDSEGQFINFKVIDLEGIQFDEYSADAVSALTIPVMSEGHGVEKCRDGEKFNKQLDMRSMYALFYGLMNGEDWFYPPFMERANFSEYENVLKMLNVPENSKLYENSMNTLDESVPNEPISESLTELIEDGYSFETYGLNRHGYQHRLIKK